MARPSRQIDERLLRAGRDLLPVAGIDGLSVRRVAAHAGVNLGMFHYHFRSKDAFVRAVLQGVYEDMYAQLTTASAGGGGSPMASLRGALHVLAGFARANRQLLVRILVDALGGGTVSRDFLAANIPRHLRVLSTLVRRAQRAGEMQRLPVPLAMSFLAGAVAAPILLGGALQATLAEGPARLLSRHVLSERAAAVRIDLALRALGTGATHAA